MQLTLTATPLAVNSIQTALLNDFLAQVEKRAFRIAEIATRDRDEALDLVQDAMVSLARSYGQGDPDEWPPLFFRILENRIRDWHRRQAVKRRLMFWRTEAPGPDEAPEPEPADPNTVDVLRQMENAEAMHRLEEALRMLPQRQREAFELRLWHGLSVEQTATAMRCSEGSVKTHLSRALRSLRLQLNGVWP